MSTSSGSIGEIINRHDFLAGWSQLSVPSGVDSVVIHYQTINLLQSKIGEKLDDMRSIFVLSCGQPARMRHGIPIIRASDYIIPKFMNFAWEEIRHPLDISSSTGWPAKPSRHRHGAALQASSI